MRIELLTTDQYNTILSIYEKYPELSLQNKGYEGIDKSKLSNEAKEDFNSIEEILKDAIAGFVRFQNFKLNKEGEIQLRFQYNYGYDGSMYFIGVGYILLDELLNGFKD